MSLVVIGIVGCAGIAAAAAQAPRSAGAKVSGVADIAAAHANAIAESAETASSARAAASASDATSPSAVTAIAEGSASGVTVAATMTPMPAGVLDTDEVYDTSILQGSAESTSAAFATPGGVSISAAPPDVTAPRMALPASDAVPPSIADLVSPNADTGTRLVMPAAAAEAASPSPAAVLGAGAGARESESGAVRAIMAAIPSGAVAAVPDMSASSARPASAAAQTHEPRQMSFPTRYDGRKARR